MVLATDGAPNCNDALDSSTCRCASEGMGCVGHSSMCLDEARTVGSIGGYLAEGLPTYVIGIQDPGDTAFSDVLNAMADAGGRPNKAGPEHYYVAGSESELDIALGAIRDQVGYCTYLTTSVPDAKGSITIELGGTVVAYDSGGAEGWVWGNKANGEILLVGTACAKATTSSPPTLVATVQCGGS